jgi:hypothetical protein
VRRACNLVDRTELFEDIASTAGHELVLETTVLWDDAERENVRVIVDVWWPGDGRWIKSSLVSSSFIVAPDGTFVGEGA